MRQDDQPSEYPSETQPPDAREADLPGHRDRPDAVLRLPSNGTRDDPRFPCPFPALHGARPGLLQRHPEIGAQGGRWGHLRRRFAEGDDGAERRVVPEPERKSPHQQPRPRHDPARGAVQQARSGQPLIPRRTGSAAQHPPGPFLRGGGDDRTGRDRDLQGDRPDHDQRTGEEAPVRGALGPGGGPVRRCPGAGSSDGGGARAGSPGSAGRVHRG